MHLSFHFKCLLGIQPPEQLTLSLRGPWRVLAWSVRGTGHVGVKGYFPWIKGLQLWAGDRQRATCPEQGVQEGKVVCSQGCRLRNLTSALLAGGKQRDF